MNVVSLAELIMACALSPSAEVHDHLYNVVIVQSQGHPLFLQSAQGHTYAPDSAKDAIAIVKGFDEARMSYRIGVAGLSNHALEGYKLSTDDALDACQNIGAASLVLEDLFITHDVSKGTSAMHKALAAYYDPHDPDGLEAITFGARVLARQDVSVERLALDQQAGLKPVTGPTFKMPARLFFDDSPSLFRKNNVNTPEPTTQETQDTPPLKDPSEDMKGAR